MQGTARAQQRAAAAGGGAPPEGQVLKAGVGKHPRAAGWDLVRRKRHGRRIMLGRLAGIDNEQVAEAGRGERLPPNRRPNRAC